MTELADTLVRHEEMSFREAHALVAQTVQACGEHDDPATIASTLLALRPGLRLTREEIDRALDPRHFVRIRSIEGGPAPERTGEALARARAEQRSIEKWIEAKTTLLDTAHAALHS